VKIRSGAVRCFGEDGRFSGGVGVVYEDSAGNLWVGAVASLWRWKPDPSNLYRMPDPELQVHGLIEDGNGAILIGLRSGIRRLINGDSTAFAITRSPRARAYLLKNLLDKELLETIRAVHAGKKSLSAEASFELAKHATDDTLTPAEVDVLKASGVLDFATDLRNGPTFICWTLMGSCASVRPPIRIQKERRTRKAPCSETRFPSMLESA
jgi:hypothetical protein